MEETDRMTDILSAQKTGRRAFCGIELLSAPDVLVPRTETELLARTAIDLLLCIHTDSNLRLIDMCSGAGNLACYIASHLKNAQVWASDLTEACVDLALRNVDYLNLRERVQVLRGDLFTPLYGLELEGTIDAVVCNPPYISSGKLMSERAALLDHEPKEAFDGGVYGISIHQRVIRDAPDFLKTDGYLLFEFGLGQERQITKLFERSNRYADFRLESDGEGHPRVASARKKS